MGSGKSIKAKPIWFGLDKIQSSPTKGD